MALKPEQRDEAIRAAWLSGNLKYKLKPVQRKIYKTVKDSKELIDVVNCSRRLGKTTTMALMCIEDAIQNKNFHIHFAAPFQNQVKEYLLPIFNQLLEDCPADLRPKWNGLANKLIFKNGSFIKLCGCNNQQYNNMRGNKSDKFIIDEARDVDDLETVIKDIALPQLLSSKNPNKKIILPSTPPTTPDHPYKRYAEKAKARGAYSEYTIDESWYTKEEIERFLEESGGRESTTSQREYFCKFVTESSLQIVPEWKSALYVKEVAKDDYFKFYIPVESMDVGYRDFTAWVLGYYDFNAAKLVIEHEIALRENEFTTEKLAEEIKKVEDIYRQEKNEARFRRISDNNNLNILADLARIYRLPFIPVNKKSGKEWMVNQLRQFVKAGKLLIHPRCKMLITSLEFGIWKKNRDDFERSADLGHYDFVDAMVYLVAGLIPTIQNHNPIPPLYQLDLHKTMFPNNQIPKQTNSEQDEVLKKLFRL